MLAGEPTIAATLAAFLAAPDLPMPERLMSAMEAGESAGGDRRGRQSAAMKLVTTEDFPDLDLRVDDHTQPLAELLAAGDLAARARTGAGPGAAQGRSVGFHPTWTLSRPAGQPEESRSAVPALGTTILLALTPGSVQISPGKPRWGNLTTTAAAVWDEQRRELFE